MDLKDYRSQIDKINSQIVEDINQRMEIVEKIAEYKKENNMDIEDKDREKEVIKQFKKKFKDKDMSAEKGRELGKLLIEISKEKERKIK